MAGCPALCPATLLLLTMDGCPANA